MITLTPKKSALLSDTERLLQIAEAIDEMKRRHNNTVEQLNGFQGTFRELRIKLSGRLDTQKRAYSRLKEMYKNQLDKITSKI